MILRTYNKLVAPFTSKGLTLYLRQQIVVRTHDLLNPLAKMIAGLRKNIASLVAELRGGQNTNDLHTTYTLYFVRSVEALAFYIIINDQIRTSELTPINNNTYKPRLWDLINQQKAWKAITDRDNVDKMFRDLSEGDEGDADGDAPIKWPTGPNPRPFQGIYKEKPEDEAGKPGASSYFMGDEAGRPPAARAPTAPGAPRDPPTAPGATGTAPGGATGTAPGATITTGDSGDAGDAGDSGEAGESGEQQKSREDKRREKREKALAEKAAREALARAKAEERERLKEEAAALERAKAEERARAKEEAEALKRAEAEEIERAKEEARAKGESEKKAVAAAKAKAKVDRAKAAAEARARLAEIDAEARARAEEAAAEARARL